METHMAPGPIDKSMTGKN